MTAFNSLTRLPEVIVVLSLQPRGVAKWFELTISSYDVHPEPEALLSMVVQRFGCREESRNNTGVNILTNALILHWPLNSPSCIRTHTWQQTDTHTQTRGQSFRTPSVTRRSVSCPAVYLITAMVRVTTLLALCGYILAG